MNQESRLTQRLSKAQERGTRHPLACPSEAPTHNPKSTAHTYRPTHGGYPEPAFNTSKVLYRLYTEEILTVDSGGPVWFDVTPYVNRYFAGATIYRGVGLDTRTQNGAENALIIEVVSSLPDGLQRALNLAGDLRIVLGQVSVLVTVQDVRTFEVVEQPIRSLGGK